MAGYGEMVRGIRFGRWMAAQRHFPTAQQVMDRFGCHRATAFRWLAQFREAVGMAPARKKA